MCGSRLKRHEPQSAVTTPILPSLPDTGCELACSSSKSPKTANRKTPIRKLPAPVYLYVIRFTGRSHSACDSIRFLKRLTPDGFISCSTPPAPALFFMDEDQGRPGPVALQFGHLDAPKDVPNTSLCPAREPSPKAKLWMPQVFRRGEPAAQDPGFLYPPRPHSMDNTAP